jgi:uncharacterized protein (DUF885 family)
MNKGFRSLADRVVETLFEISPFFATCSGAHHYDHLLDRHDPEARTARRSQLRDAIRELRAYENAQLTLAEEIDLSLVLGQLQAMLRYEEDIKPAERNPAMYVQGLLQALHAVAARECAPVEDRARPLIERLKGVPFYLETAAKNLKSGYDLPATWCEIAIEELEGADLFFRESLMGFAKKSGRLEEPLSDAVEGARRQLLRWKTFLKEDLLPRCDGSFAIGRDCFEYLVEKRHGLNLKAKDLIALGEEAIARARAEIERAAAEIAPGKKPEAVFADLRKQHPAPEKLFAAYEKEVRRARDFVAKKDLVSLPEGEKLSIAPTPAFLRPLRPCAAYMPPAPFEQKQEGFFFVTPVGRNGAQEKAREQLEGHALASIAVIAVHNAYPGHHVQSLHANRSGSKPRRAFRAPIFAEGWAHYCEELMLEEGFFQDPKARLEVLRKLLLCACRVVIDTKLQLQQMRFDEAVDLLVNVAGLDRAAATAEVRRDSVEPTFALSYLLGKREIVRLRDEARQQRGEKWKLEEFHDKLLSLGTIPLDLARSAILK